MQWDDSPNAGFSHAPANDLFAPVIEGDEFGPLQVNLVAQRINPNSLWHIIRSMIAVRKAHPAFGQGRFAWAETGKRSIAAYWRIHANERILVLNNLSSEPQTFRVTLPEPASSNWTTESLQDLFSPEMLALPQGKYLDLGLEPYQYRWFKF